MAAAKLLDDPDHINSFLSMIGASPIPRTLKRVQNGGSEKPTGGEKAIIDDKGEWKRSDGDENAITNSNNENKSSGGNVSAIVEPTGPDLTKNESVGTVTPEVRSRAHSTTSSPAGGTKAPPPTPVNTTVNAEGAPKLEPIEEDEADVLAKLVEESKLGLGDSKFASHKGLRYPVAEYKPGQLLSTSLNQKTPGHNEVTAPPSAPNIKEGTFKPPRDYMDGVVCEFQKDHINDFKNDDTALKEQAQSPQQLPPNASTATSKESAPSTNDYETAITPIKPVEKVSQDVKTAESKSSKSKTNAEETSPNKETEAAISTAESKVGEEEEEEDREHLTHVRSWGKPQARDKTAARVRRLTLSSLPADADLTLVQSLVHGGAIDDMVLMGASGVAYVRFTSGDACDKYCEKYQNGLTFRYRGRSYTVFVDKCTEVDIISGMLQGHIDCGASRCVRVIDADEDWGMGALKKLAEGKSRKGKVENITDVYRNGIRTIVFRFTSISEAVTFKAMLTQDEDWEACNVQFAADPCEKAGDVHLE